MGAGPDDEPLASPRNFFSSRKGRVAELFAELLGRSFLPLPHFAALDHYIMRVALSLDLDLAKFDQSCFRSSMFGRFKFQGNREESKTMQPFDRCHLCAAKPPMRIRVLNVITLATFAWLVLQPSEAQTLDGLSETDVRKIDEATQTAVKAALAKDFATWSALFLDDAVVNPPNEPAVKGRAAIRAWLEKFPPITEFKLNNEKVEGREDVAYVLGTYTMTIVPPGAPGPVKDSGKFVTVLRRQPDGRWLAAVDMFSSDLPGPTPPK
jgi:ketosteroid isomerase-like protein